MRSEETKIGLGTNTRLAAIIDFLRITVFDRERNWLIYKVALHFPHNKYKNIICIITYIIINIRSGQYIVLWYACLIMLHKPSVISKGNGIYVCGHVHTYKQYKHTYIYYLFLSVLLTPSVLNPIRIIKQITDSPYLTQDQRWQLRLQKESFRLGSGHKAALRLQRFELLLILQFFTLGHSPGICYCRRWIHFVLPPPLSGFSSELGVQV